MKKKNRMLHSKELEASTVITLTKCRFLRPIYGNRNACHVKKAQYGDLSLLWAQLCSSIHISMEKTGKKYI